MGAHSRGSPTPWRYIAEALCGNQDRCQTRASACYLMSVPTGLQQQASLVSEFDVSRIDVSYFAV